MAGSNRNRVGLVGGDSKRPRRLEDCGDAWSDAKIGIRCEPDRNLTYDPATTVGALPHFRFHLLSRSTILWELLTEPARLVTERRTTKNICVRKNV